MTHRQAASLATAVLAGTFLSLLWLERRRPLRDRTEPQAPRLARNVTLGIAAASVLGLAETPVTARLTRSAKRHGWGLVPRLVPPLVQPIAALLLLDYTLYVWHLLLHRVPALWRWHRVHHADRDLDVSTSVRFHAMELLWSVPWRAAQIVLIGVPQRTLSLWAKLTMAEVMFHHSNLRLPHRVERVLGAVLVTPTQHGIHHANVGQLQHANLSSGLSVWDHLHGTACDGVPQSSIRIGLPPGAEN